MNYYKKHLEQIAQIKDRPSLLIHVCCGVCSVYPLIYLRQYFDISIYFANSNIYPYEEYLKRLDALNTYLKHLNDSSIKLIIPEYDNKHFMEHLFPLKEEKEGGKRCKLCYYLRMKEAFVYAKSNNYDYCTTIMSISNRKNADYINEIGMKLEKEFDVKYLFADFKKGDGITLNEKMNKDLNLYHQNYCGCIYSKR